VSFGFAHVQMIGQAVFVARQASETLSLPLLKESLPSARAALELLAVSLPYVRASHPEMWIPRQSVPFKIPGDAWLLQPRFGLTRNKAIRIEV
jgi:hypothetical protein